MSRLKIVHVARRALGLHEDDYRAMLERTTGQRSAKGLDDRQVDAFLAEAKAKGFRPAATRPVPSGPYLAKAQKLWIAGYNLGCVHDRRDSALAHFVKRQCGVDHLNWVRDARDGSAVIEALKAWLARDGGVDWSLGTSHARDYPIAWAQWVLLKPRMDGARRETAFAAEVASITGKRWPDCGRDEWIAVMNELGRRLRRKLRGRMGQGRSSEWEDAA